MMISPSIQYTNQAVEDLAMFIQDLQKTIANKTTDYRLQIQSELLSSFNFQKYFKMDDYGKIATGKRAVVDLGTLVPGIYMIQTKFGHCVFFRLEQDCVTIVRVLDGRAPYMVALGSTPSEIDEHLKHTTIE